MRMNWREGKGRSAQPSGSVVGTLDQFLIRAISVLAQEIALTERRESLDLQTAKRSSLGALACARTPDCSLVAVPDSPVIVSDPGLSQNEPSEKQGGQGTHNITPSVELVATVTVNTRSSPPPSIATRSGPHGKTNSSAVPSDSSQKRKRGGGPQRQTGKN